ncbi:hypothetical protein NDU88_000591 [Pleurodeles waltl]|uniref:Uncharacterized protein n=1 Tax=Pleurodeles waltl TaxID=8319 RepID=A0AAV7U4F0_PLEWA|nr:hypothetical protein NDU88_000591 [Pleurodeles waltl]
MRRRRGPADAPLSPHNGSPWVTGVREPSASLCREDSRLTMAAPPTSGSDVPGTGASRSPGLVHGLFLSDPGIT